MTTDPFSIPPLRDLPTGRLDQLAEHLNAEISSEREGERRVVTPSGAMLLVRRVPSRPLVAAALAAALLAMAGAAIADGFGAFSGIGAAQHPQGTADILDPETAAYLQDRDCVSGTANPSCGPTVPNLLLSSARLVGQLPTGQNLYVITTTGGLLCAVVQGRYPPMSCGATLGASKPTTVASFGDPTTNQPVFFGVAMDGVTAISFTRAAQVVTVPVRDNVWEYEGPDADVLDSLTAHFADGTSLTVNPSK